MFVRELFGIMINMQSKDYAGWHAMKLLLNATSETRYYREREVWWTAIGLNIGFEEDGKRGKYSRPVVVLCKFNPYFFYGVPLSTTKKAGRYYGVVFLERVTRKVLLTQVRAFDAIRLLDQVGIVRSDDYKKICSQIGD